ncbi:lycopene beta-cyclase CrtY [Xanthobacter sp. V4C-4]|uniref:lycopene beta-cyclase CrtY n=1 Tax=Xanthobacter cornucopiae TaxID=3119924 RepID=UPI00372B65BE
MEILFVGAGLANSLIAARLFERRRDVRFLLLEAGDSVGGNHTWSFHGSDLDAAGHAFIAPFRAFAWSGHEVRFPAFSRTLSGQYGAVTSEQLSTVLSERICARIRTHAPVVELAPTHVVLADGTRLVADAVVDGRGAQPAPQLDLGFQKFVGQELRLARPHGLTRPLLMDARVPQLDGYRFVYVLPLDADTLLVEDTYYADGPDLPVQAVRARIGAYIAAQGWELDYVAREETGVLPIALGGDIRAHFAETDGAIARTGLRAALFHPTTGYSLPDAVALAERVSTLADLSGPALAAAVRRHAVETWERRGFFRLLNRMLFRAAAPERRYIILQRFYGLSEDLIARFYADRLTLADKARILTGRPPVSILRAARCLPETRRAATRP